MARLRRIRQLIHHLRDFTVVGLMHYSWLKLARKELAVTGSCHCCGNCCRALNLEGPHGWLRSAVAFASLVDRNPEFSRFEVTGKDSCGYLLFRCRRVDADGLCTDYEDRPSVCREFPHKDLLFCGGMLPTGCGYKFIEIKSFHHVLIGKMKKEGMHKKDQMNIQDSKKM